MSVLERPTPAALGTFPFTTTPPSVGTFESPTLEFKVIVITKEGFSHFELAKDVSALANASGGTILVGARAGNSQLVKYEPIETDAIARNIALSYENAVKDRCAPPAQFSVQTIASPTGFGILLAIHVPPSPTVVAVKTAAQDGEWNGDAWVFFRREAASQNRAFRPELLPMFMTPEIRRIAILLRSIPAGAELAVDEGSTGAVTATIEEISELTNRVVFKGRMVRGGVTTLPLEAIRLVYLDHSGKWIVRLR